VRAAVSAAVAALAACSDDFATAPARVPTVAPSRAAAAPEYGSGRWTVATLFEAQPPGGRASAAHAINESGQVTGSYVLDGAGRAFRVTAGQQNLELLGGPGSIGLGINDAGQVAGREGGLPVRWDAAGGSRTVLSSVPGSSSANAVNGSGVSVGFQFGGGGPTATYARLWAPDGSVTPIAVPGSDLGFRQWSAAVDVNEGGTVLVQASLESRYDRLPFLWTATAWFTRLACPRNCPLGSSAEAEAHAINDGGVVVGPSACGPTNSSSRSSPRRCGPRPVRTR
jgi:uncharacterized membrane protein